MSENKEVINLQQSARWLPADLDTPISLFMAMSQEKEENNKHNDAILLESAEVDGRWGRYSILACHTALNISCKENKIILKIQDDRLKSLEKYNNSPFIEGLRNVMQSLNIQAPEGLKDMLPPITRGLYGYFSFGMASLFVKRLQKTMPINEAECTLTLPKTVLLFDHLYNRLCQISLGEHAQLKSAKNIEQFQESMSISPENFGETTSYPNEQGYKDNVVKIKEMIRQGEAIQVVPSVRFSTPFKGETLNLYRRMRSINASPYMFYMKFQELSLFGSSPEVMIGCNNGELKLSPIAGTRKRGKTDQRDNELAEELLNDPKERAEHIMLVDLGRNDLGRIAKANSINIEKLMQIERFSHVMHITSRISAKLAENLDALDILAATFPAGTVSGAPKVRAMEIIREIEGQAREPYAGCIGWLGLDKDSINMDMGITIRSMWHKENTLYWQSGGGIVHDSDPELEWKEICNKSAIMRLTLEADKDNTGEKNNVSFNR